MLKLCCHYIRFPKSSSNCKSSMTVHYSTSMPRKCIRKIFCKLVTTYSPTNDWNVSQEVLPFAVYRENQPGRTCKQGLYNRILTVSVNYCKSRGLPVNLSMYNCFGRCNNIHGRSIQNIHLNNTIFVDLIESSPGPGNKHLIPSSDADVSEIGFHKPMSNNLAPLFGNSRHNLRHFMEKEGKKFFGLNLLRKAKVEKRVA